MEIVKNWRVMTAIGLVVLLISVPLPWLTMSVLGTEVSMILIDLYHIAFEHKLFGEPMVSVDPVIEICALVTLVGYFLAVVTVIIALLFPSSFAKLTKWSGILSLISAISWMYAVLGVMRQRVPIVQLGLATYMTIIAGAIFLGSYYLYTEY